MPYSSYLRYPSGSNLYAKPLPLAVSPTWDADDIAGVENGSLGSYAFTGLADGVEYEVFRRAGATPASTDLAVGSLEPSTSFIQTLLSMVPVGVWSYQVGAFIGGTTVGVAWNSILNNLTSRILGTLAAGTHNPQSGDAFAEVVKVPRRSAAVAGGAAVTKTNTSVTPNQSITETIT